MTLALHSGILAAQALTGFLKKELNLRMATEIYSHEYNARLLPAFQRARWLRKMISLPGLVRIPLARLIQMTGTTESLLKATRIAVSYQRFLAHNQHFTRMVAREEEFQGLKV